MSFFISGGVGAGGSISFGLAVSHDKELGTHLGLFTSAGTEATTGYGGTVGASIGFSPDTKMLETGYSASATTGGELTLPIAGLAGIVLSAEHTIAGDNISQFSIGIGLGNHFEFHTGVEHEYMNVISSLPGNGHSPGHSFNSSSQSSPFVGTSFSNENSSKLDSFR
jgi:hypothetical protein